MKVSGLIICEMGAEYKFIMMDHALMDTGQRDNDTVKEGRLILMEMFI